MLNRMKKATVEEIRQRFDADVERFSNLESGQQTTIDAPLTMELCTTAALFNNPKATDLMDIGCGAGNYTLKMLSKISGLNCTLIDLSLPMLEKAKKRVLQSNAGLVQIIQQDIRQLDFPDQQFDIILAAAVFHHLRDDADWENVFLKVFQWLKPGGSVWISDLVKHDTAAINDMFETGYADYLESIGGADFRQKVFDYVAYEDTPRSVIYQLDLLKKVGFSQVEILHKNACFASFGAVKSH
jgi:tRNA (cmo5U34)-methyltransferase